MTEYYIPAASAQAELVEKRSRFIGQICPVESEAEARAFVEKVKKRHYDARHNCWCYRLKEGGAERYSDDGEPQGTAGQPMLSVFQREGVTNVCCVVTRYFGGILLGAGGLVRAYTQSAKDALDASGISVVRRWTELCVPCPYHLLERVKQEAAAAGGTLGEIEYGAQVTVHVLLPQQLADGFSARMTELSAGGICTQVLGDRDVAVPVKKI